VAVLVSGLVTASASVGIAYAVAAGRHGEAVDEAPPIARPIEPALLFADPPTSRRDDPARPLASVEGAETEAEAIRAVLEPAKAKARACYEKEREKKRDVHGSVRVTLEILRSGSVGIVRLSGLEERSTDLDACLTKLYKGLVFPSLAQNTTVSDSLGFYPPVLDRENPFK
jgi:hypothetical protein